MIEISSDQLSSLGAAIGIISTVGGGVYLIIKKFTTLEIKVDLLFNHVFRSSIESAVKEGIGHMNSPLVIKEDTKSLLKNMSKELSEIYKGIKKANPKATDTDLFIAIDHKLGDRIMREVAIPNGISTNACVIAAVHLCKEGY